MDVVLMLLLIAEDGDPGNFSLAANHNSLHILPFFCAIYNRPFLFSTSTSW